jgi:hypothetical protein
MESTSVNTGTPAFHYRHININHPENETWVDQEEDGETTTLEAGTGDSPNPLSDDDDDDEV